MTWVGEIFEVAKGIGQLRTWYRTRRNPPAESLPARFVRLFESYGVHRNQIPRFIGHGLTLKDMQDDASLLAKLDETLLEFVCERFAVRREWLDGDESRIHNCDDFYKNTEAFANFIAKLKSDNPTGGLCGVLIAPVEAGVDAVGLLILQETVNLNGDKSIYRFHFCGDWAFTYWKARAYLAACMAIAWKQQVFVHGIYMPKRKIARLAEASTLLSWRDRGIWALGRKVWSPEDMALQPEVFLKGIHPGEDYFGVKSGLGLWLEFDQSGLMDTGIETNARQLFQQELAKYSSDQ